MEREELIHFLDSIRDYEKESHNMIGFDERESGEIVDVYLQDSSLTPSVNESEKPMTAEGYIAYLERMIETCLNDKDLQREHWAFCQALKNYRSYASKPTVEVRGVSDDEIADRVSRYVSVDPLNLASMAASTGFRDGAKWMRAEIKERNK